MLLQPKIVALRVISQSGLLVCSLKTAYYLIAEHQDKWHAHPKSCLAPTHTVLSSQGPLIQLQRLNNTTAIAKVRQRLTTK